MSVDQETLSAAIMLFDVFLQELVTAQQERKTTLERLEQAKTEQERIKLQEKLHKQTQDIRKKTTELLGQNKELIDKYENNLLGYGGEIDPETEETLQAEFMNAHALEELYNRPQRNRWMDQNGRTDLLALSKPAIEAYSEICQKADERKSQAITGARQMIPDEVIIADEIANVDYPEKAADLEHIAQMRMSGVHTMDALKNSIDDIGITKYIVRFSQRKTDQNKTSDQSETVKDRIRQEPHEGRRVTPAAEQQRTSEGAKRQDTSMQVEQKRGSEDTEQYSGTTQDERQQAAAVAEYIAALENPERLTIGDQTVIYGAKEIYDSLPENVKAEVNSAAVQKLDALSKEMDQLVANNTENNTVKMEQTSGFDDIRQSTDTTEEVRSGVHENGQIDEAKIIEEKPAEQVISPQQKLSQNDDVKALLDILEVNNQDDKIELQSLLSYVEGMERQLQVLTKVTEDLREEIRTMHNSPEKLSLQQSERAVTDQANVIQKDVRTIKEKIIRGCKDAVERFRLSGRRALNNVMNFFNVRENLENLNNHVKNGLDDNTKTLKEIDEITAEFREAKQHLRNVGNKMLGKESQQEEISPGIIPKAVKSHFQAERTCLTALQTNVDKALKRVDNLSEEAFSQKNAIQGENESVINLRERSYENLWPEQNQSTDLLTLSKPETDTLLKVCTEADQSLPFKDSERSVPFELVVLDTLANKDYPEKAEDLHRLSIMNDGEESIQETIAKEDWPQLYAGMNLKAGLYIPDQDKKEISVTWMENKYESAQKDYQYYENLSKNYPEKHEYILQKQLQRQALDFVGSNHKNWDDNKIDYKMKEFHDQAVLVKHSAKYYGPDEEALNYQQRLRNDIIQRYELEKSMETSIALKQMLKNEQTDLLGVSGVKLNRLEALTLYEQGIKVFDVNQNYQQIGEIEELLDYQHFHQFVCSQTDLENMLQQKFGETLQQNIPVNYRTEIDPMYGNSESINELSAQKQPTAASVRDELEEDVVYGIGEVGDSNQILVEEETEEISVDQGLRP